MKEGQEFTGRKRVVITKIKVERKRKQEDRYATCREKVSWKKISQFKKNKFKKTQKHVFSF